ncbi:hypothetical protein GCM10022380_45510 [Amycolatopsis tucumanensis]|uniref:Uncharacterized protein n=1 Tax=Amycolatopsis tucumanensis TaxID=401106 RepID=A0ABP7ILI2_9PSEU
MDVDRHHAAAGARRFEAPHIVEELTGADHHVRAQHERGEQGFLPDRAQIEGLIAAPGPERAEHTQPEPAPTHHTAPNAVLSTRGAV